MARLLILVPLVALVASCAPTHQAVWRHHGYTPELWARDSFECERIAQVPGMMVGMPVGGMVAGVPLGSSTDQQVMGQCLQSRGWVLTWRELPR